MQTLLLVIHVMIAIGLTGVVLLQRSEGGGLGMGTGGGGSGGGLGVLSGRAQANLLTRTTAILAAAFMLTSIVLAILGGSSQRGSVLQSAPPLAPLTIPTPGAAPAVPQPAPNPQLAPVPNLPLAPAPVLEFPAAPAGGAAPTVPAPAEVPAAAPVPAPAPAP